MKYHLEAERIIRKFDSCVEDIDQLQDICLTHIDLCLQMAADSATHYDFTIIRNEIIGMIEESKTPKT